MAIGQPPRIIWESEPGGELLEIGFDAITAESHEVSAMLTTHPVESGQDLSDYKRPGARRLTLECFVTNTPLGSPPPSGLGPSDVRLDVEGFTALFDRVRDVYESLRDLVERDILVDVATGATTYTDLSLVKVNAPKNSPVDGIRFTIEAEEVRIAETLLVEASAPREPRARRRESQGSQEAETSGRRQSIWSSALEGEDGTVLDRLGRTLGFGGS